MDQPDQSVVRVGSMVTTVPPGVALGKALDYTDGPLCVQVEECSRQFYNLNKDKVSLLRLVSIALTCTVKVANDNTNNHIGVLEYCPLSEVSGRSGQ